VFSNIAQDTLPIHTFIRVSELTYHSSMLRGRYYAVPALYTVVEGARHIPQYVEEL